jgi:uncharacterized RDD family membrane protein YckC
MNWYYVQDGKQAGPVDEGQFRSLIQSGVITLETLVWKEGLTNWRPLRLVQPDALSGAAPVPSPVSPDALPGASPAPAADGAAGGSHVTCVECGQAFAEEDCLQYGSTWVCAGCKPVFVQKLREGAPIQPAWTGAVTYGGFWIRLVAKMVDAIVMGLFVAIPMVILFMLGNFSRGISSSQGPSAALVGIQILVQVFAIVAAVSYNTFFVGKFAATPGKMACGLKVVTAEGGPVSYWRAFGRAWAEQLSGMVCYLGYIMAGFDGQKRTLHDHICNTRVVKK